MKIKNHTASSTGGKQLLDFASSYLSESFPNPGRKGCPSDSAVRSLAFNPKDSEPTATEHLAACSPCFRRYAELLAELKSQRQPEQGLSWRRTSAWFKAHPVMAGTALACALFIAIGVGLLIRGIRQPNAPRMDTHRKPNPTEPLDPTLAYLPFSVDLGALSPVRGAGSLGTAQLTVPVPSSPLNLTLTLPFASAEGLYDLNLTTHGKTFWSKSAAALLHKGKTLIQVEADFRQIPAGDYTLEVRSPTGIHLIQSISIHAALPTSTEPKL